MTCQEMDELLAGYVAQELPPAQTEFVRLHLDQCPHCRLTEADLLLTRRQLATLREERWQPRLTGRITHAMRQANARRMALRWAQWALRAAAVAAALYAAVSLWDQPLPLFDGPAPAGTSVPAGNVLVLERSELLRVDVARQSLEPVLQVHPNAGLIAGGGSYLALSGGKLSAVNPRGGSGVGIAENVQGRLAAVSPDGRSAWLVRQSSEPEQFWLDRLDIATGEVSRDPGAEAGHILSSAVSPDGQTLYMVARVGSLMYLKLADAGSRRVERFYSVPGMALSATPLAAPDGTVYVADLGRVLAFGPDGMREVFRSAQATPVAMLTEGGKRLVMARAGGGLMEVDLASGRVGRQQSGPAYSHITVGDGWLFALTEKKLAVVDPGTLRPVSEMALPGPANGLVAR